MTTLNTTISLRFTPIVVKYCPKSVQFFVLAVLKNALSGKDNYGKDFL